MKHREFRDARIRERLHRAADRWRNDVPGRSFETSDRLSLKTIVVRAALIAAFACLLFVLASLRDNGLLLLALVLPAVAILTSVRFLFLWSSRSASETTYVLPFSNRLLTRQLRAETWPVLLGGATLAALAGAFGHPSGSPFFGGFSGALLYFGFLGFLTLSHYWRFFTFFILLAYTSFFLLLGSLIFTPIKEIGIFVLKISPWYHALQSLPLLFGFFGAGVTTAFATRQRWWQVSRFDRTSYYQKHDPGQLEDDELELHEEKGWEGAALPAPSQPTGIIEKLSWRFFTLPEKGLLRAMGWTRENFFRSWLKSAAIFIVLCGLTHFPWPDPIESLRTIAPFLVLGSMIVINGICHFPVTACLGGYGIGSGGTAARFQLFPITLPRAEKLMIKESLPRWLLFPLLMATAPLFHPSLSPSISNSLTLFGVTAFCQIHGTFFYFANNSINEWPPPDSRSSSWSIFIKLWLLPGILASLIAAAFILPTMIDGMTDSSISLPGSPLIFTGLFFLIFHLILRTLIRAWISSPRADLVRQN